MEDAMHIVKSAEHSQLTPVSVDSAEIIVMRHAQTEWNIEKIIRVLIEDRVNLHNHLFPFNSEFMDRTGVLRIIFFLFGAFNSSKGKEPYATAAHGNSTVPRGVKWVVQPIYGPI